MSIQPIPLLLHALTECPGDQPLSLVTLPAAVLVLQGVINLLPARALAVVNKFSVAWNLLGLVTLIVLLPSLAVKHQSASFVFTTFITESYGFVRNIG